MFREQYSRDELLLPTNTDMLRSQITTVNQQIAQQQQHNRKEKIAREANISLLIQQLDSSKRKLQELRKVEQQLDGESSQLRVASNRCGDGIIGLSRSIASKINQMKELGITVDKQRS